jgi:NAD(P)-dependent dehydrogenase (short-subunit alcohol dehydrogenase family)
MVTMANESSGPVASADAVDPAGPVRGRRVLVVGGSAGIGRAVGLTLAAAGARVAFAARRSALCEEVARLAGGGAIGLACDVTSGAACERVVAAAADQFGGLDAVVYTAAKMPVISLAVADEECWRRTLETNVIGAALVTRAALPRLLEAGGSAVYLSTVASQKGPWPGMGVYGSSKAALARMIDTWRSEYPELGFTRIDLGPTAEGATTTEYYPSGHAHQVRWPDMGLVSGEEVPMDSVCRLVTQVLADPARFWDVTVQPRDPARPWNNPFVR